MNHHPKFVRKYLEGIRLSIYPVSHVKKSKNIKCTQIKNTQNPTIVRAYETLKRKKRLQSDNKFHRISQ